MAGGPLRIPKLIQDDKTFFFVNYSGTRSRNPYNGVATLPSALERAGDFSQSISRGPVSFYDPTTRLPFAGNVIPRRESTRRRPDCSPSCPLPNQPGRVQNYQFLASSPQNSDNLGVRLSRSLSRKDRLAVGYNLQQRNGESVQLYGFRDSTNGRGQNMDISWTHNIRQGLINTLRGAFSRNRGDTSPFFAYGRNVAAELGITGTSSNPVSYGPPNLSFTNFGGLTDASAVSNASQTASLNEGLLLARGKHSLRFGGEYRRTLSNSLTDQNGRGTFLFSGLATSALDANGQPVAATGFDFADYSAGLAAVQFRALRQRRRVFPRRGDQLVRAGRFPDAAESELQLRPALRVSVAAAREVRPHGEPGYRSGLHRRGGGDARRDRPVHRRISGGAGRSGPQQPGAAHRHRLEAVPEDVRSRCAPARASTSTGRCTTRRPAAWRSSRRSPRLRRWSPAPARPLTLQNGFPDAAPRARSPTPTPSTAAIAPATRRPGTSPSSKICRRRSWWRSGYLGTKGTRLDVQRMPNRAAPGSPLIPSSGGRSATPPASPSTARKATRSTTHCSSGRRGASGAAFRRTRCTRSRSRSTTSRRSAAAARWWRRTTRTCTPSAGSPVSISGTRSTCSIC